MNFEKTVTFLGYKDMRLRDGTDLLTVSFYVDESAVEVNVLASNFPVASSVKSLSFGDTCTATFTLRKSERLYRLSLTGLA